MDIKIEAPGHPRQVQLKEYYNETLLKKYSPYEFIKTVDVKVVKGELEHFEVSLQIRPEKGGMLFAKDSHENETKALNSVIKKMNSQIDRYKQQHYKSAKRGTKK